MKRLDYQEETVERFSAYLEKLVAKRDAAEKLSEMARQAGMEPPIVDWCGQTWDALKAEGKLPMAKDAAGNAFVPPWLARTDGMNRPVPNVCLKLPTGAGKTYLATRGIEQLQRLFYRRAHGLVLWVVPSDAIYSQTWKNLANREHPYRMTLERASGGRVKLLRRGDSFTKTDVENHLCVLVMMMAAAARQDTDVLKMFRDTGKYDGFFPAEDDFEAHKELRRLVPNLEVNDLADAPDWGGAGVTVKQSLGNVLCLARPTVILDEGHTAYTPTRRTTLAKFNPSFILELSATPNRGKEQQSNVLHSVSGMQLKKEEMLKLPLILHDAGRGDWKDTLAAAHGKLTELQALADRERDETGRYVRPVLLVRVERTGKDQTEAGKVHADHVRDFLQKHLGADPREIAEKSSAEDELTTHNLMDESCPVRFIITKDALREGWDCPFAYVLAVMDATTAGTALTQMIGRILRQPEAQRYATSREELNQSHVFVRMGNVAEAVRQVQAGLESEGMGDLGQLVRPAGSGSSGNTGVTKEVERRAQFRRRIFLPRVLAKQGDGWRLFDYESDLYPHVPWEELEWHGAATFSPDDAAALLHRRVAVDVDQLGADGDKPRSEMESGIKPQMDFPALVRLLADVIPSPWQAARILRSTLAALRARGITEDQLLASRYRLVETMRMDLMDSIHQHTEKVFCDLLAQGEISFRLEGKGLSWELMEKLTFEVTPQQDYPLHKSNGKPLEKSLFEEVWSCQLNKLETPVALYLDDVEAVRWWHRIAVLSDWYVEGWKKKRVFPDFLVALDEEQGKASRLIVVETKGLFLKNEDTAYKQKLFEVLEKHCTGGVNVGELALEDQPGAMRFRVVFDGDWKTQVDAALGAHPCAGR
jgi:type III restriction enzyme